VSDWLHGPYWLSSIGVLTAEYRGEECQPYFWAAVGAFFVITSLSDPTNVTLN
jgi:hypothetical protein